MGNLNLNSSSGLPRNNRYRRKWLLLGIIWFASISLFAWNISRINSCYKEKNRLAAIKKINAFMDSHMLQLRQILKERDKFYDHVPNAKIGILRLEEMLHQLAYEKGLSISHMEQEENLKESNSVRLHISCYGPLNGFIGMLSDLFVKYPYIQTENLDIKFIDNKNGKYEIRLVYNYIINKN